MSGHMFNLSVEVVWVTAISRRAGAISGPRSAARAAYAGLAPDGPCAVGDGVARRGVQTLTRVAPRRFLPSPTLHTAAKSGIR